MKNCSPEMKAKMAGKSRPDKKKFAHMTGLASPAQYGQAKKAKRKAKRGAKVKS